MKTRSKSNNFIAMLIAVMLFAAGFIMYFIHEQSESKHQKELGQITLTTAVVASNQINSLSYWRYTA